VRILIDSSVWINYFRGEDESEILDSFIDENIICTNQLILAELIPALKLRKQTKLIKLLEQVTKIPLNISWKNIVDYQTKCLSKGINKIGIPDLIIVDNVVENNLILFSLDKHFRLINGFIDFKLFDR
jgi:predicted nucleic acid-binding protein